MSHNRRRHRRRVTSHLGTSALGKIFVDNAFIRDCMLQNISAGGASLQVYQPSDIPDMFDLVLGALDLKRGCHVVWRSRDKIGVEFNPDPISGPT